MEIKEKEKIAVEMIKTIESMTPEQVGNFVLYWWSGEELIDRVKENMDSWWVQQTDINDMKEQLEKIKIIANGVIFRHPEESLKLVGQMYDEVSKRLSSLEKSKEENIGFSVSAEKAVGDAIEISIKMIPLVEQLATKNIKSLNFAHGYSLIRTKDLKEIIE